jgi:16S rRNA (cytosine1402-N4)-methyltransferase
MVHTPVLLQEVVDGLQARKGDIILDATVGGGGHSEALCKAVGGKATIVCLDADEDALLRSQKRLAACGCSFRFYQSNFRHVDAALQELGIRDIQRALFDLGLSSFQLEESGRGFSFQGSEPLLMTYTRGAGPDELTAEHIVNEWDEENIATILHSYGEERAARRIAAAIVRARGIQRITTTAELREIVERAVPRRGRTHPATKTFQALRMAVNDELRALTEGMQKAWNALTPHGRLAVISFHSLEDRIVKTFCRARASEGKGIRVTRKPITPTRTEVLANPRARSAKLRIIEKV